MRDTQNPRNRNSKDAQRAPGFLETPRRPGDPQHYHKAVVTPLQLKAVSGYNGS